MKLLKYLSFPKALLKLEAMAGKALRAAPKGKGHAVHRFRLGLELTRAGLFGRSQAFQEFLKVSDVLATKPEQKDLRANAECWAARVLAATGKKDRAIFHAHECLSLHPPERIAEAAHSVLLSLEEDP